MQDDSIWNDQELELLTRIGRAMRDPKHSRALKRMIWREYKKLERKNQKKKGR